MKRGIAASVIVLAALGVPMFSHAAGGTGDCVSSTTLATAPSGSQVVQSLDPVDSAGTLWVYSDGSSNAQVGVKGSHGYLIANGDSSGNANVRGYQTESGVNGNANSSPSICLSAGGQKISAP
ncbi:MAG: hypothetical protein LC663_01885 [Actinobacteria bacterium]|nr:hypothetical protein [Actinomycetota bacterium]